MDRGTLDCAAWGAVHCMALSLAGTRRVRYAYPRTRRVLLATFALTHKPYRVGRDALRPWRQGHTLPRGFPWRDGRAVDCSCLENSQGCTPLGGSNPS